MDVVHSVEAKVSDALAVASFGPVNMCYSLKDTYSTSDAGR